MKEIYTVTTLYLKGSKIVRDRTHGWYLNKEEAIQCVKDNWGDIYECGYYNYALVEKSVEGLYNMNTPGWEEHWFSVKPVHFEYESQPTTEYIVKSVDKPEFLEGVVNFSMG